MKIDSRKLELILARRKKSLRELRCNGLSPQTLARIRREEDVKPKSIGILAEALGVDPAELLDEKGE